MGSGNIQAGKRKRKVKSITFAQQLRSVQLSQNEQNFLFCFAKTDYTFKN
jgi:hypothetical protein